MARAIVTGCLLVLSASAAEADRLELLDGRKFEGVVTVQGQTVAIEVSYGTLQFPKSDVHRIVFKDTPQEELARKLSQTPATDAAKLFAVGQWVHKAGLKLQAKDILARVIGLEVDHAGAQRLLGFVRIDRQWHPFEKALELARGKLEAGQHQLVLKDVLPALSALELPPEQRLQVGDVTAHAQLRAGKFPAAAAAFEGLSRRAKGPVAQRYGAIGEILRESPRGMYLLTKPYPPGTPLTGSKDARLPAGPASLSRPLVLKAALWKLAKAEIKAGQTLLAEARKDEATDPDSARNKYARASQRFKRADALVPRIAASYHIEIARRRIAAIRGVVDGDAKKFDALEDSLGRQRLPAKTFRETVLRMLHYLDNVRDGLKDVLTVAKPYPRELVMEVKWAQFDLEKIEAKRKVLASELGSGR